MVLSNENFMILPLSLANCASGFLFLCIQSLLTLLVLGSIARFGILLVRKKSLKKIWIIKTSKCSVQYHPFGCIHHSFIFAIRCPLAFQFREFEFLGSLFKKKKTRNFWILTCSAYMWWMLKGWIFVNYWNNQPCIGHRPRIMPSRQGSS